jgi:hypothetical protein
MVLNKSQQVSTSQTPEGYISKDIYIPYPIQKSGKMIFSYPFFEWDMLKDIYPYFRIGYISSKKGYVRGLQQAIKCFKIGRPC